MSKLVVDQIQKSGGPTLTLPTVSPTAGQMLASDASGNLSFTSGIKIAEKVLYSSERGDGSIASIKVMWTDLISGISTSNVEMVELLMGSFASSSSCQLYIIGQNSSAVDISTGQFGCGYHGQYNGGNHMLSSTTSSGGVVYFPVYSSMAAANYSYGSGITGHIIFEPTTFGTQEKRIHANIGYQQSTSYNYPNNEMTTWGNYATNTVPATWHGIRIYPSNGNWSQGSLVIRIHYR
jgi:hypothetical protein